jgi:Uma2 family endonuclease
VKLPSCRAHPRNYASRYATPADIALATEISELTLASYRSERMPRYAAAKVPVYWIVNLVAGQAEVYSNPVDDQCTTVSVYTGGQEIPVAIGSEIVCRFEVSDVLP